MVFTEIPIACIKPGATAPRKPGVVLDTIVVHYTATPDLTPASYNREANLALIGRAFRNGGIGRATAATLNGDYVNGRSMSDAVRLCLINAANKTRTASWHFCVSSARGPMPEVVTYVPPSLQAHHVGALNLPTNSRSIGIEIVHPGPVPRREPPKATKWGDAQKARDWYSRIGWRGEVSFPVCPDGVRRWFMPGAVLCLRTVEQLVVRLCLEHPTINCIASHHLFSPKKRIDPDPPFDLKALRNLVALKTGREYTDRPTKP